MTEYRFDANLCRLRFGGDLKFYHDTLNQVLLDEVTAAIKEKYIIYPYIDDPECFIAYFSVFWGAPDTKHNAFQITYRDRATREIIEHGIIGTRPYAEKLPVDLETYYHTIGHVIRTGAQILLEISACYTDTRIASNIRSDAILFYKHALDFFRSAYVRYTGHLTAFSDFGMRICNAIQTNVPTTVALNLLRDVPTDKANVVSAEFDSHKNCEWMPRE